MKPFEVRERKPLWVQKLKSLHFPEDKKTIIFNYPQPIEAMFYTDCIVYDKLPDKETLLKLKDNNYHIVINNSLAVPNELTSVDGLTYQNIRSAKRD